MNSETATLRLPLNLFEYQFTRLNNDSNGKIASSCNFLLLLLNQSTLLTMLERQFIHFEIDVVSEPFRLLFRIKQGDEVSKNEEIRGASFFWWVYILTDKAQIKTSKHKIKNVVSRWCGVFSSLRKKECPPTFLPGTPVAASYVPQNY